MSSQRIRPIETRYKGYRFRSRLEARWAVFFDALWVEWEYEKEGYDLGDAGCYLPDFWIHYKAGPWPDAGEWIEIKPCEPDTVERRKMACLVEMTGHRGYIFCGCPGEGSHQIEMYQHHRAGKPKSVPLATGLTFFEENCHAGTEFEHVGLISVGFGQRPFLGGDLPPGSLAKAFQAARSVRFEHGESQP